MDFIRNKYFIKTVKFDSETIQKISDKSSIPPGKLRAIFREIDKINLSPKISEADLININYKLEKFYERVK
jgi:hypothetical protein